MLRKLKAWSTYSSRAVLKDYGCHLLRMNAPGGRGEFFSVLLRSSKQLDSGQGLHYSVFVFCRGTAL